MNPDCTKKERGETLQDALQSTISSRAKAEIREKALVEMPARFRASRLLRNDQEWSCRASKGYRKHQD